MKYLYILFTTLLVLSCSTSDNQKAGTTPETKSYPDQESWNATMFITREGKTIGHLKAAHVQKFTKKNITLLDGGIQVDFYNEKGRHTSVLTSDGGEVMDATQDMTAYGHVVVVSDSGLTLHTDTLKWNNKKQKIYSKNSIILTTTKHDTLYGDGFVSDPDLANYEITNPRGKSSKSLNIQ